MIYAEARSKIQSGDVLAWTHIRWSSWNDIQIQIVRIFTRSEYSHVGIAWVVGGRVFVLEAVSQGVRIFPLSRELPFYWLPVGVWDETREEMALALVGAPYSKWDAVLSFFGRLVKGENASWQCSEYVAFVLGLDPARYTPTNIVSHLQDRGATLSKIIKDAR